MAELRQARGIGRRPVVVAVLLLSSSLIGAALPNPAEPTTLRGVDQVSFPTAPAIRAATPPAYAPDRKAPIVDIIPGRMAPSRVVVEVPKAEAHVILGPSAGSTAVFLGDSFTSGWDGAGMGSRGWPRLVSAAHGWKTVNLAVAGTGFINPGWTRQPIGALVAKAARHDPDVIVVAGGHNDSRWSSAQTARAADDVIDRIRAAAPDALLVVVAPIWQDGSPPRRCLELRDQLREKSAAVGAVFVDPLADGWFSGASHRLIGPDGLHPTDAGHAYIAERVLAGLGT